MIAPKQILWGGGIFFIVCSAFIFTFYRGVNSPDESANKLFAQTWSKSAELFVPVATPHPDAYPLFARSTVPTARGVAPSGFIGIPIIYGTISGLLGDWSLMYLTVFFTAVASLAWWYVCRHIFGESIAAISFWLFLFQPAVLYYSVRGLFPNMVVLDFIIIAVAAAWHWWLHRTGAMAALAVVGALAAIAVRPPEAMVLFGLCALSAAVWGDLALRRAACKAGGAVVLGAIIFFLVRFFGAVPGGYQFLQGNLFFPFGIHLAVTFLNVSKFIVWLFAPWVIVSTTGLIWWVYQAIRHKKIDRLVLAYLTVVVPASMWLFVLYGSWQFSDNPADPSAITLGASYVRYWLPHLVFRLPFAAVLLLAATSYFHWNERRAVRIFLVCVVVAGILRAVVGADGLWQVGREVRTARLTVAAVLQKVPPNAVLAVRAWDKHFFAQRAVLQPFPREVRAVSAARELKERGVPVWAFIESLNKNDERWLAYHKVRAVPRELFGPHTLYEIFITQ